MTTNNVYITEFNLFKLFKYVIYILLTANIFLFLHEEFNASIIRFSEGLNLLAIYQAFPATIDTFAWVVLLILFELETFVFEDRTLKGLRLWTLHGIRALCYAIIFTAFWGYVSNLESLLLYSQAEISQACQAVGYMMLTDMNEYIEITAQNCASFTGSNLLTHPLDGSFLSETQYEDLLWLAWTDVINSATWMLVCIILEVDVYMQLKLTINRHFQQFSRALKSLLYGILFWAAVYWGYTGSLLDFWDAFLWLVAFFFIEMNLFDWQAEVEEAQVVASSDSQLTSA